MLPKIKHPKYTHHLVGLNRKVTFRPFTNSEQKILLLAKQQKDDTDQIFQAVIQVLENCILDDIDVGDLTSFDMEDIFLRIRAKSVGELITPRFSYKYTDEKGIEKSDFVKVEINIDDIKVKVAKKIDNKIILDQETNLGVQLRYPTLNIISAMKDKNDDIELISKCIVCVFDSENVYNREDTTDEEMIEFVEDIDMLNMGKINKFFAAMPSVEHKVEVTMPKLDNKKETITFKGINDFFI